MTSEELAAVAALWKRTGRRLTTEFTGTSMLPAIADGASVELICVDDVSIGDVIAYVYGDRVIVHRIVAMSGDRFITRGDANLLPDAAPVERSAIIGRVQCGGHAPSRVQRLLLKLLNAIGARNSQRLIGALRGVRRQRLRAEAAEASSPPSASDRDRGTGGRTDV